MIYPIKHLPPVIPVGVQTESGVESIGFDVKPWMDEFDGLSFSVWVTRADDASSYPAADVELVGTVLYWQPNVVDTAVAGAGKVEILAITGDKRKLSGWCGTMVKATSLAATQETPEAARPWVDEVLEAAKHIKESIVNVPYISDHGTWMMWDAAAGEYVDSGTSAKGKDGQDGYTPIKGKDYTDGKDGHDGISPVVELTETTDGVDISVADVEGEKTATIKHGKDGRDGVDGQDGDTRVYVGSDTPPEGAEVWIDPQGVVEEDEVPGVKVEETEEGILITAVNWNGVTTALVRHGSGVTEDLKDELVQSVIAALPVYGGETE